jgi:putative hydrolase of the HAD superfamily
MRIHAVVWDVDDTLFDYTTADRLGMRAHLAGDHRRAVGALRGR